MTVVLVAANGGHLAQLVDLAPRLPLGAERLWVTPPGPQSDSLLAGEQRVPAPPVAERDVLGVARTATLAARLFRRFPVEAVVSTGSGIALGFLPLAAAWGIPAFYIESSTFVSGPSLTGRLLQRTPRVRLFTQHAAWAGRRWRYGGSVFDGFVPAAAEPDSGRERDRSAVDAMAAPPLALRRVVVTLGSDRWSFRRLVDRLVAVLPREVEVVWQVGTTPVDDLDIEAVGYLPAGDLHAAIRDADVVVAHAGCGSAITALQAGKVPVLVPRDPAHHEVVDRHQYAFADGLAARGLAVTRAVDDLTLADLHLAAGRRVSRAERPEPFDWSP